MRRSLKEPKPGRLVLAVMWSPSFGEDAAMQSIAHAFGPIRSRSDAYEFSTYSVYYEREMGAGLRKRFVEIEGLCPRDALPACKRLAVEVEDESVAETGARRVNVDPLLVTLENIVVTTSKNFPHRFYLGEGVFGELALVYRDGAFADFPWTYKDYIACQPYLTSIRSLLHATLQNTH
jgi:hypothetical protein